MTKELHRGEYAKTKIGKMTRKRKTLIVAGIVKSKKIKEKDES